ncbi:MAG: hypothetical protein RBR38_03420 [Desulfomicrobium apsheronum]|nr:hypothetical protein [Desulfomicrobium apsheronum]
MRVLSVFAACALFGVVLCGCAGVLRYERGPLVAFGEVLEGASEPLYYLVNIDLRRRADSRVMTALVKLGPEAPAITVGELRPETVSHFLPRFSPPPQWPQHMRQKALADESYEGGGFHLTFRESRLVSFGICSHCSGERHSPVVGTPEGRFFYPLPLTRKQVEDVFGPAFTVRRAREVTYGP